MITRRHALKLAAALPFVAPLMSSDEANAALDLPLDARTIPGEPGQIRSLHNPVDFARTMEGYGIGQLDEWPELAPVDWMTFVAAVRDLQRAVPALADPGPAGLLELVKEAAMSYGGANGMAGLRAGAAYENLRLALLSPFKFCPECHASEDPDGPPCSTCAGRGVVPTPGVVARWAR